MKIKTYIIAIILALFVTNSVAGGLISKAIKNPIKTGLVFSGLALYSATIISISRKLSNNLSGVTPYFEQNPEQFDKVATYVINALNNPNNINDYNRYKKLAIKMELEEFIPPYKPRNNLILHNKPGSENNIGEHIIVSPNGVKIDTSTYFPIERPQTYNDFLLLKSNSQELSDNMKSDGVERPANHAAHHIVPATDKRSQDARDILDKYKIGINDSENGVYLPTIKADNSIQGIKHSGKHPQDYIIKVNMLVVEANKTGSREEVIRVLKYIGYQLQNAPRNSDWSKVL